MFDAQLRLTDPQVANDDSSFRTGNTGNLSILHIF